MHVTNLFLNFLSFIFFFCLWLNPGLTYAKQLVYRAAFWAKSCAFVLLDCRGLAHCPSALYSFIHTPVGRHLVVSSFQILINYYYYWLLLCVWVWAQAYCCAVYKSQRTPFGGWFSPSTVGSGDRTKVVGLVRHTALLPTPWAVLPLLNRYKECRVSFLLTLVFISLGWEALLGYLVMDV